MGQSSVFGVVPALGGVSLGLREILVAWLRVRTCVLISAGLFHFERPSWPQLWYFLPPLGDPFQREWEGRKNISSIGVCYREREIEKAGREERNQREED